MTLTITLTAQIGSASGVNFNTDYTSYFADLTPTGWPYILGGGSQFDGDQIVLLDEIVAGQEDQTKTIILDGEAFNYYFNDHTLSGRLQTIRLSTLGDSYNADDQSFDLDSNDHIANVSTSIEISGLDIYNAYGERGVLHEVIYGLMGGTHEGGGTSDPTKLSEFIWAEGHNVIGSTGGDTYSGTDFADTVRGNGGNDVLDGKAGTDTAVFSGKTSDYTITRNADGSITVQDKRTAKDGKDTLRDIEIAKFSDGTVDLTKVTVPNEVPTSLALSKSTITENRAVNTTVGTFSAIDPEGKALTYTLTDTAGGLFKLSGNKLVVASVIDYEKVQSDTVTLQVKDADGGIATKTFTITVSDVLETITGTSAPETLKGGIGADKIMGDAGDDTLYGYAGNDQLYGGDGNDTLIGGAGADKLYGNNGVDTASYETATAGVTASLADSSINAGDAAGDTYSSIANLTGSKYADKLTGDDSVNVLNGGAGNDTLTGNGGKDILIGGAGADKLIGGADVDTASYSTATAGVTASLAAPSINTGDAAGDTYSSIANLAGSKYADKLTGDKYNNELNGGAGKDVLTGNEGKDILIGGANADDLYGGSGADTFRFLDISDSGTSSSTQDTIFDFLQSEGDRIDLSAIDAIAATTGNQAFTFIGTASYSKTAGELRYVKQASDTYIYGDVNGDGKSDFAIHLDDAVTLSNGDFLL